MISECGGGSVLKILIVLFLFLTTLGSPNWGHAGAKNTTHRQDLDAISLEEVIWSSPPQEIDTSTLIIIIARVGATLTHLQMNQEFPFFDPMQSRPLKISLSKNHDHSLDIVTLNVRGFRTRIGNYPKDFELFQARKVVINRLLNLMDELVDRNICLCEFISIPHGSHSENCHSTDSEFELRDTSELEKFILWLFLSKQEVQAGSPRLSSPKLGSPIEKLRKNSLGSTGLLKRLHEETADLLDKQLKGISSRQLMKIASFYENLSQELQRVKPSSSVGARQISFSKDIPDETVFQFLNETLARIRTEIRLKEFLTVITRNY